MLTFREIMIFITGMQFFHTVALFFMWYYIPPFMFVSLLITSQIMFFAGIGNVLVTLFLFWIVSKLR